MILLDNEIRAIQARHPTENNPMDFAHAIIAATIAKLAAGVSMEPVHERIVGGVPCITVTEHRDILNIAVAAAHAAGRKSVHDKCVDLWKDEFLAAARVQALEEAANPTDDQLVKGVKAMRLFVTNHSVADFKLGYVAAIEGALK